MDIYVGYTWLYSWAYCYNEIYTQILAFVEDSFCLSDYSLGFEWNITTQYLCFLLLFIKSLDFWPAGHSWLVSLFTLSNLGDIYHIVKSPHKMYKKENIFHVLMLKVVIATFSWNTFYHKYLLLVQLNITFSACYQDSL